MLKKMFAGSYLSFTAIFAVASFAFKTAIPLILGSIIFATLLALWRYAFKSKETWVYVANIAEHLEFGTPITRVFSFFLFQFYILIANLLLLSIYLMNN